jgi:putative endonuclease
MNSKKIKNYKHGLYAEYYAALWLMIKGYRILKLRYKCKVGEIDIIAQRGKTTVFIEVKYRQTSDEALNAITPQSLKRIRRAAEHYIAFDKGRESSNSNIIMRFDVVTVTGFMRMKHIQNAF